MVNDGEKFKAEDEAMANKIQAKNWFENYCFQMKNTLDDEKLRAHFTDEDKKVIQDTSAEGLQWLEGNQEADTDAINRKQKELEAKFNPIIQKVYQAAGGAYQGMPNGMNGGAPQGAANSRQEDTGVDDLD